MIYKDKYYSALNDGHICTDGNWYPNEICYRDYYIRYVRQVFRV